MSVIPHQIYLLELPVEQEHVLSLPLLYPEISRLQKFDDHTDPQFHDRLKEISIETPQGVFFQRILESPPAIRDLNVKLTPPKKAIADSLWREEATLQIHYACWSHQDLYTIAYVPALDIKVVRAGKFDGNFVGQLQIEIRNAMIRYNLLAGFDRLVHLARLGEPKINPLKLSLEFASPKQIALKEDERSEKQRTVNKISTRIDRKRRRSGDVAFMMEAELERLAEFLKPPQNSSVLMVGPSGCGKTSLIRELGRQKELYGFTQPFRETSGSRIVAGMSGFGQWQERCEEIVAELRRYPSILHLGNLVELLDVGKSVHQSQGIASFLRPFIQRGNILVTAECSTEQLTVIEKADPQLLSAFSQLKIEQPDQEKTKSILRAESEHRIRKREIEITDCGVQAIYDLHKRYATYSAMPARPIRFLRNLIKDTNAPAILDNQKVTRAFAHETGLPYFLLSQNEPLDLNETHKFFSTRVIGQPEPVDLVTNLFSSIKANLTPTGRPIASLLFLGPTGVGKTEMAKSIAEFMYSQKDRLVRIDMSEYSDRMSIDRLIGAAGNTGILTSKIRQNPFTVLLLDEFEKAHPAFFDLLLQILGEGRLTDTKGRVTDFSTAIVIMTSNLGATTFREKSFGFGENDQKVAARDHFVQAVEKFIRPELFNRIDRVVPFNPLDQQTVEKVAAREVEKLTKREGIWFRGVDFNIEPNALTQIAALGNDSRYGARPLQRFIQSNIAVPLSDRINRYNSKEELQANVTFEDNRVKVAVKSLQNRDDHTSQKALLNAIEELQEHRRRAQAFNRSSSVVRLRNEFYRLKRTYEKRLKTLERLSPDERKNHSFEMPESLVRFETILNRIESFFEKTIELENEIVIPFYQQKDIEIEKVNANSRQIARRLRELLFEMYTFDSLGGPRTTNLFLFSRHRDLLQQMIDGYRRSVNARKLSQRLFSIHRFQEEDRKRFCYLYTNMDPESLIDDPDLISRPGIKSGTDPENPLLRVPMANLRVLQPPTDTGWVSNLGSDLLGIAISISGTIAFPLFSYERGLHQFKDASKRFVLVEATGSDLSEHSVNRKIEKLGPFDDVPVTRTYHHDFRHENGVGMVEDGRVGKIHYDRKIADAMESILELALEKHLQSMVEPWN